jgi:type I restriction enzyme S subunit
MSEWQNTSLGSLGQVITGKTPSKDNPEDWGRHMLFVTPTDYKNYTKFGYSSTRMLSLIGSNRQKARVLPVKSVLVTCIGSDMGKSVINYFPCVSNQQINAIVPNQSVSDNDFVYYLTRQLYDVFRSLGGDGTAVPILNKSAFENISVEIPPLPEQKAIAAVLSSLDDKIDLLHRQNKTLEAMAETLFRQWFIDKEIIGTVAQLIKIQNGFAFKSKDFREIGSNSVLKIKNISGGVIDIFNTDYIDDNIAEATQLRFKVCAGDILIGMTGAEIGKLGVVPNTSKSLWLNQRVGLLIDKFRGAKYLAYLQLKSDYGQDYIENTATGSAQPNISGDGIEGCGFPLLSKEEIESYSFQIEYFYEKITFNLGQIQTLEKLRDNLLPKLMSGEVRVSYDQQDAA